jgi:TonB-linked SusC/RagA family outer membrane protein
MKSKILFILFALFTVALNVNAQGIIKGKVSDENGKPLSGVTVKATPADRKAAVTAVTDETGTFSVKIANAKTVAFSYVGYESQTVAASANLSVVLKQASSDLSEVVVVGYGTQKRKEATGALTSIKGSEVAQKPIQSFEQGLAGKSSGVQITIPSGVLNSPPVFRIRGTNSISLSSYPLIIVDGVPSFTGDFSSTASAGNALASINPNDIESIDIAKDAAATAIYGSRAANGVVFITTKKGKSGKMKVSYDASFGESTVFGLPKMMDALEYQTFKTEAVANNPSLTGSSKPVFTQIVGPKGLINTNWFDYIYRKGNSFSHNVSLSGGNEGTSYYFAVGYNSQEGIIRKNDFKRMNVLANVDSRITKAITIGGKIAYSNEANNAAVSSGSLSGSAYNTAGLGRNGLVLPPLLSPFNIDGSYNINGASIGQSGAVTGTSISYYNPVVGLDKNRNNSETNRIQSNFYVQVKPFKDVTFKSVYGIDYLFVDNDIFYTPLSGDGYSSGGYAFAGNGKYKTWLWTNTAQFDHTYADKHSVSLLLGNEQQRSTSNAYGLSRTTLSDNDYTVIQAGWVNTNPAGMGLGENFLLSSFSRLNYNYDRKYFLSANIRQDEYSALGEKKGIFWGASGGWELSSEKFWKTEGLDKIFTNFKLKGSYGKVGNIGGINDYAPYSTFGSGLYGGQSTLAFSSVGNNKLTWETSYKTDYGVNFGLFKNRIQVEAAYYENNIDGLILNVAQSPSTGLPSSPLQNVGSMYNRGKELSIDARIIEKQDFQWSANFNITQNENVVTALAPGLSVIQTATSGLETNNQTMPGYSLGYLWVVKTAGVDPGTGKRIFLNAQGTPVYYQYYAPSGQYNYSTTPDGRTRYISPSGGTSITQAADAVMYKNTQPRYYGGFTNNIKYKNFDFSATLTFQADFWVYYGTNSGLHDQRFWNNAKDVLTQAWRQPGDMNMTYAKPVFGDNVSNGSSMPLDINVFKGDFVKLKNLSIGYTLPKTISNKLKLSNARFYVSGQNLAIWTKYPGPDPEVSSNGGANTAQGVDRNTVANARTITFGLNIGF